MKRRQNTGEGVVLRGDTLRVAIVLESIALEMGADSRIRGVIIVTGLSLRHALCDPRPAAAT